MNPLVYLIKINAAIAVCYLAYVLFFRNDTFLRGKRILLLSMSAFSLIYPFFTMFQSIFNPPLAGEISQNINAFGEYFLGEIVITANAGGQAEKAALLQYLPTLVAGIYFAGVTVMLIRILLQSLSIGYQIFTSKTGLVGGRKIYVKSGLETPFSFFGFIVIDPARYDANELSEIMQHEETHVRQRHTIDLLAAELVCAFCWFNPFAWLLNRETRLNLEYLADRSVLDSGCNSEHYQFHLLRLTYNKAFATITNNFNVSQLKKRIIMINKRKTSNKIGAKYLLVLPVAALLLCLNCTGSGNKEEKLPLNDAANSAVIEELPTSATSEPVATTESENEQQNADSKTIPPPPPLSENTVYQHVEVMPSFPGGDEALMKWLSTNLVYPVKAQENGIEGTVTVRFIIKSDGTVSDAQVVKSLSDECDAESLRVFDKMPKWIPGKQSGKAVNVYYNLPIRYRLQNAK
ncbi:MAG: M56 family metallopeptidase [Dysgonamonadaceae bacterium]|jgi:TonB family protein|nr:M56 family metallopeptidase [Dysgonamonadaceae bacterium]